MLIRILVSLTTCVWLCSPPAVQAEPRNAKLRDELLQRMQTDQEARKRFLEAMEQHKGQPREEIEKLDAVKTMRDIDRQNTERLKEIIEEHGWPGKTLVGEQAAFAAWLIVQHADHDRPFQKCCLGLLGDAVKAKEAAGKDLAYLTDRVLIGEKKKQLYGTQLREENGKLEPEPIEDEEHADERRRDIGLPTLAIYLMFAEAAQATFKAAKKP